MVREKQIPRNVVTLYYAPTVEGGEENGEIKFGTSITTLETVTCIHPRPGSVDDSRCVGALTYMRVFAQDSPTYVLTSAIQTDDDN